MKEQPRADQKVIGADILAVQWKWPVGKPLVDSLGGGLWEVRSSLRGRIARIFFVVVNGEIVLLHGIIKKSQTAPKKDLDLARSRQSAYMKGETNDEKEGTRKRSPRK
ncbi:type II toxin-antitoxin system RelE/ParE family toxin [Haloferula sp. A504]|uniref:type II toxin-antitoxin system RelE/ParE family toxin n=1 Tax=Haloferula sp. A504 TaxID=3373601 RepID=UPI0037BD9483